MRTPGHYFLSKGIVPLNLTSRLELLPAAEREVVLLRAASQSLRTIAKQLNLTAEGVRYLEAQAITKLRENSASEEAKGQRFRQNMEQLFGQTLEQLVKPLRPKERKLVLGYANGVPLAELAPALGLSVGDAVALRDKAIVKIGGEEQGSKAEEWAELKAQALALLSQGPLSYSELEEQLPLSRHRLRKLMTELVQSSQAEVGDELPMRFYRTAQK